MNTCQLHPIIIVDDEPDICEAIEMALVMEGYQVMKALDRETALHLIDAADPALVFLDYRMPGLEAKDFVEMLRRTHTATKVILMTASADPGSTACTLGLDYYLAKPFELDKLLAMVKDIQV